MQATTHHTTNQITHGLCQPQNTLDSYANQARPWWFTAQLSGVDTGSHEFYKVDTITQEFNAPILSGASGILSTLVA